MLSNDPKQPQASPLPDPKSEDTAQPTGTVMDPHSPIEVASTGTGTTNDPAGSDGRPPAVYGFDSLV